MPRYDFACAACGHEADNLISHWDETIRGVAPVPCPQCGAPMGRVWKAMAHVQGDEIPGGMTVENMGPEPLTFHSKSAWRAEMKRRGLVQKVEHVPIPGSDKSPHTTRWV